MSEQVSPPQEVLNHMGDGNSLVEQPVQSLGSKAKNAGVYPAVSLAIVDLLMIFVLREMDLNSDEIVKMTGGLMLIVNVLLAIGKSVLDRYL